MQLFWQEALDHAEVIGRLASLLQPDEQDALAPPACQPLVHVGQRPQDRAVEPGGIAEHGQWSVHEEGQAVQHFMRVLCQEADVVER